MNDPIKTREQLDACRPGMSDECLPEMHELAEQLEPNSELRETYGRSQQLDYRIAEAFRDVDVPVGLEDRLLAALAHNEPPMAAEEEIQQPERTVDLATNPRTSNIRAKRKRITWGIGLVAALSLVAAMFISLDGWRRELPVSEVCRLTPDWVEALPTEGWQENGIARAGDRMPSGIRPSRWEWQEVTTPLGSTLVLRTQVDGQFAYLMISSAKAAKTLLPMPPGSPMNVTGPYRIGVWGKGNLVYVLAVDGGDRMYRSLVRRSTSVV